MNEKQQTFARVALFVALVYLVLIVTPRFFGVVPPAAVNTGPDVSSLPSTTGAGAVPPNVSGTISAGAGTTQVEVPPTPPEAPAESLTVADSLSRYLFTSRGASITAVSLLQHHTLGGDGSPIQLLRDGESLLRYQLFVAGDTLTLSDLSFTPEVLGGAGGVQKVSYRAALPRYGGQVVIEYTPVPDSYLVQVTGRIEGIPSPAYLIVQMPTGLRSGETNVKDDQIHFGAAYRRSTGSVQGVAFRKLDPGEQKLSEPGVPVSWVTVKSKYFIVGLLKAEGDSGFAQVQMTGGSRTEKVATHVNTYVLDEVSDGSFAFEVYAGPQQFTRLVKLGRDFQNSNPYGGLLQPVVQPFAVLVMRVLLWLKQATNLQYGWVLVIFGVLVRLLLWPLNQKAMRTTMRMQRIQPELNELQKKHKGNPQKLQEELMRVYKDHGMTPFSPLAGCLPMLIPMPVLFALFFVFQNTIEFRGVPFLWLPDISLKDPLYIVPVFMGLSMFLMSWLGSRNAPPNPQMKMMLYVLPIVFTVLFLNFASGLNLYYAVQNVAALPQQYLISRERLKATPQSASKPPPATKKKGSQESNT